MRGADQNDSSYPLGWVLTAAALFVLSWAVVHLGVFTNGQIIDTPGYHTYALDILHRHLIPYRDFAIEYPPGALPVFVLPELAGNYFNVFSYLMAACGLGIIFLLGLRRPPRWQYLLLGVWPLLTGSLIASRFDLWPALLVTAALVTFGRGRTRLGWALLAVAAAAKIWPLVLAPLFLVVAWRRRQLKDALAGVVALAVCIVPFLVLAARGLLGSVNGQLSRPLQIESLGGAIVEEFGHPQLLMSHGSQNLAGQGLTAALLTVAAVASLIGLWAAFARGPASNKRLYRYSAAAACAFVAFGKVLSPQFLIWLLPLCLLVRGRRGQLASGLLVAAMILTQLWFPGHYWQYVFSSSRAWIVLSRDLVLIVLLAVLALPVGKDEGGTDAPATADHRRRPPDPAELSS